MSLVSGATSEALHLTSGSISFRLGVQHLRKSVLLTSQRPDAGTTTLSQFTIKAIHEIVPIISLVKCLNPRPHKFVSVVFFLSK